MPNQLEEFKNELISEINIRKDNNVIEPQKAELLIDLIKNANSEFEALTIAEMGTIYRRTGFYYDVRPDKKNDTIKYLVKRNDLSFDQGGLRHKLIIGDNYAALRQLLITHKGKINVIYIDPPYGCNSMGEFADTNYENQITRDNLLSMLDIRLRLAKKLLAKDGVIFVSIDDKNQAYIKCLLDDIFGESNFIGMAIHKNNSSKNQSKLLSVSTEYVLIFALDKSYILKQFSGKDDGWKMPKKGVEDIMATFKKLKEKGYSLEQIDEEIKDMYKRPKYSHLSRWNKVNENGVFKDADLSRDGGPKDYTIINPNTGKPCVVPKRGWGKSLEELKRLQDENLIWYGDESTPPGKISYITGEDLSVPDNFWFYDNSPDVVMLNEQIFDKKMFSNPKPVDLIKHILTIIRKPDAVVLDFFAGSGTTGHAVLDMNRVDNGKRTFILCTNNEKTEYTPNGIAYDCTTKRLKRIMSGKCYDGYDTFKWLEKNTPYGDSLDVYEIGSVSDKSAMKGKTPFDVIDETNYGLDKFSKVEDKIKWVCENFERTEYSEED